MSHQKEQEWKNISDLLSTSGKELNILEEEIDIEIQQQYMKMLEQLVKSSEHFKELLTQAGERAHLLQDDSVPINEKKKLLVLLATTDNISIYRQIEAFSKLDTPLKKWATVALQQSRMLIQSTLMDESAVFVSTGLGGHGSLLRYFCVFIADDNSALQPFQNEIVRKEAEMTIEKSGGSIEDIDFFPKYITLVLLLPINADLKSIFEAIIDECNTYGNFLKENIIVTNVKKLSIDEIEQFIESKKSENGTF